MRYVLIIILVSTLYYYCIHLNPEIDTIVPTSSFSTIFLFLPYLLLLLLYSLVCQCYRSTNPIFAVHQGRHQLSPQLPQAGVHPPYRKTRENERLEEQHY